MKSIVLKIALFINYLIIMFIDYLIIIDYIIITCVARQGKVLPGGGGTHIWKG